ncbi:MAG: toprim domain-containing protein [Methylococcales bacterium]
MSKFIYFEMIDAFKNAIRDAGGIPPDYIEADGQLHRCYIPGHKAGSKNGAYVLHSNGHPAGYFEDFKHGIKITWRMEGNYTKLSESERSEIAAANLQRQKEFELKQQKAAEKANAMFRNLKPAISHPYLTKKKIPPHNSRICNDALVIPIYAPNGELVNLQFIDKDGNKRFLSGGRKKGCFSFVGKLTPMILICEGYATGASLHEDSGHWVVVAMDAGNLEPVAREIKKLYPNNQIVICGDNDASGIGQLKAKAAAMAVFGTVLIPEQTDMDWNDVLTMEGF